jgi:hypothetical protein
MSKCPVGTEGKSGEDSTPGGECLGNWRSLWSECSACPPAAAACPAEGGAASSCLQGCWLLSRLETLWGRRALDGGNPLAKERLSARAFALRTGFGSEDLSSQLLPSSDSENQLRKVSIRDREDAMSKCLVGTEAEERRRLNSRRSECLGIWRSLWSECSACPPRPPAAAACPAEGRSSLKLLAGVLAAVQT